ncbi:hypothetical protein WJ04_09000 [Burkholderia vietnamiensis]|uniref:hypothetical protein n=1 Tax=Burkholderia vietnamiensis TaxID=60552 RepID=UPI000757455D|nr:hypothetical protein [Burkholderia vietnamiensis]KVF08958.1 hypothetical protein WJ04_09000 [Burkholderia vietnamiensis]
MNKVTITVSGAVGSGKSALCGEIEILCKALGLQVNWIGGREEKNLTYADWTEALEMYKPSVTLVEQIERKAAPADAQAAEPVSLMPRVADLLHLLSFATIHTPSEGDEPQIRRALHDLKAIIAAASPPPAPASAPVGLTEELRAVMQDAARSLSVRADELKESNTSINGEWCDADEKAAYDAEVRLVERLRALLATQQPEPRDEVTEFLSDVATQNPEKPDYWSACSQCERNIDRAQDLLDGLAARAGDAS